MFLASVTTTFFPALMLVALLLDPKPEMETCTSLLVSVQSMGENGIAQVQASYPAASDSNLDDPKIFLLNVFTAAFQRTLFLFIFKFPNIEF